MIKLPTPKTLCRHHYQKATHCIFDLDGTILDSEVIYHKMVRKLCRKYGKEYGKDLESKTYGLTDHDICVKVKEELNLALPVDVLESQLEDLSKIYLPKAPLKKGAERLITHLYEYNIPLALATNSTAVAVRVHCNARPKLFEKFHHMVCATDPDVDRGKPFPDLYLTTAARFPDHPKPGKCLVFEDSKVGVRAAVEAGMQVVMIPVGLWNPNRRATLVIRSLENFKPELFGLPSFDVTRYNLSVGNKKSEESLVKAKYFEDPLLLAKQQKEKQRRSLLISISENKSCRIPIKEKSIAF